MHDKSVKNQGLLNVLIVNPNSNRTTTEMMCKYAQASVL